MNDNFVEENKVVVTDIRMPFGSMVVFLIKLAFAGIPALLILWGISALLMMILMVVFGGMWGFHGMSQPFPF
ncbi:MAG: hypothetical protein HGB00_02490 [Chlorobiaceae bacterium]|nr:hypothetical protein [Chlorobiaceae bacterium]